MPKPEEITIPNALPNAKELAQITAKAAATQKAVEAMYFHFNKYNMTQADVLIVLSAIFKMMVNQQETDAHKKDMTAKFHEMTAMNAKPSLLKKLFGN